MKVCDYIVDFFLRRGVKDFFGYQGTMISYFVDALGRSTNARNHSCYNEQGAAFAACGAAQSSKELAVAYATSGPGAVNLLSGVANAYFDSLPVFFITGQVNTYEYLPRDDIRQHSFQEIRIVDMAKPVCKYAVKLEKAEDIRYELEKAYHIATSGHQGSVLLDIPMNLQRSEIDPDTLEGFAPDHRSVFDDPVEAVKCLELLLAKSSRPSILLGNGVDDVSAELVTRFAKSHRIPIVTTLLGKGLLSEDEDICFGYLGGAYGIRAANMIAAKKTDLLICLGTSLVTRQTGVKSEDFARDAVVFRIDIDPTSFARFVGRESFNFCCDLRGFSLLLDGADVPCFDSWLGVCRICRDKLGEHDRKTPERFPNRFIERLRKVVPQRSVVSVDVGQHMMWIAQSYSAEKGQRFLFSGGHGAMGYALPVAIGASYVRDETVLVFAGDGSFQMNIQELQWVVRDGLPLKIFVLNNHALGMVRVQQKLYFDCNYEGTSLGQNYDSPDFSSVARSYGIRAVDIDLDSDLSRLEPFLLDSLPLVVVVDMPEDSFAYPKTLLGNPVYNQDPEIPSALLNELIGL